MAITIRTPGTWSASTGSNPTVTLPTHQDGDMLLVRVTWKSDVAASASATIATAGWTKIGQGSNGTTNSSNGGGSVFVAAFFKVAESASETNPQVTFADANPAAVVGMAYQKAAGEMWISPKGNSGPDTTSNTAVSATIASLVRVYSGDVVDFFTGIADDTTMTVPTITQTGVTFNAVTESPATALSSTTGFDIAADGGYRTATAGTATAAAVVTGTLSTSETGSSWMTVLRVMTPPPTGQAQAKISGLGIKVYGQAQAQIKALGVNRPAQTAARITGNNTIFEDQFNRSSGSGMGTGDSGHTWTLISGSESSSVNGSAAVIDGSISTSSYWDVVTARLVQAQGYEIYARISINSAGAGTSRLFIGPRDGSNGNQVTLAFASSSAGVSLFEVINGTGVGQTFVSNGTPTLNTVWNAKIHVIPSSIDGDSHRYIYRASLWLEGTDEPGLTDFTKPNVNQVPTTISLNNFRMRAIPQSALTYSIDSIKVTFANLTRSGQAQALIEVSTPVGCLEDEILALNPIMYYRLGEPTGIINDLGSINKDDVTPGVALRGQTGLIHASQDDGALTLSGTESIFFGNDPTTIGLPMGAADRAFGIWLETVSATRQIHWHYGNPGSGNQWVSMGVESNGQAHWNQWGGDLSFGSVGQLSDGNPHNVWYTVAGTTLRCYIDGVEASNSPQTIAALNTVDGNFWIGSDGNDEFNGTLDEAVALDYAPTGVQIARLYTAATTSCVSTYNKHGQALAAITTDKTHIYDTFDRSDGALGTSDSGSDWVHIDIETPVVSSTQFLLAVPQGSNGGARIIDVYLPEQKGRVSFFNPVDSPWMDVYIEVQGEITNDTFWSSANAISWYLAVNETPGFISVSVLRGNGTTVYTAVNVVAIEEENQYYFRWIIYRKPNNTAIYAYKIWQQGSAEPDAWIYAINEIPQYYTVGGPIGIKTENHGDLDYNLLIDDFKVEKYIPQGYAQAQALIVAGGTHTRQGQAQARVKNTYSALGQAQALVKNTYRGYGQAQAWVKNTYNVYGQAQARIKNTYRGHGQAQAQIKQVYRAHAQAQARIKQTYSVYGQTQARIKNTYSAVSQAQSLIKNTYNGLGQAQAKIKAIDVNQYGQSQAYIKSIGVNQFAQAQARVGKEGALEYFRDTFTRTLDQDLGTPDYGTYSDIIYDLADIEIDGSKLIIRAREVEEVGILEARAGIAAYNVQISTDIYIPTPTDLIYLEASWTYTDKPLFTRAGIYLDSPGVWVLFAGVEETSVTIDYDTWYTLKFKVENGIASAKLWERDTPEPYWMLTTLPEVFGVNTFAPEFFYEIDSSTQDEFYIDNILVTEVLNLGLGQAQAQIKNTYLGLGQAQAGIKQTYFAVAQAQANIKNTYRIHAQARSWLKKTARGHGQARAFIFAPKAWGQAAALINGTYTQVIDTFTRTVADGAGTADIGGDWTFVSGTASNWDVNGSELVMTGNSATYSLNQVILGPHIEFYYSINMTGTYAFTLVGAQIGLYVDAVGVATSSPTFLAFGVDNLNRIKMDHNVDFDTGLVYINGDKWWVKGRIISTTNGGYRQYFKTWKDGDPEPGWLYTSAGSTRFYPGHIELFNRTNGLATITVDDLNIYNVTPVAHGQAQAQIKGLGLPSGQAQASIKAIDVNQHAQSQAQIKQIYFTSGQAQGWIETTYDGLGQAAAWIKDTYSSYGQSQTQIKQTYYGHGQAMACIKGNAFGQAQAWIEATYIQHGQAQADIKQTYRAYGQANALISKTSFGLSQAQAQIKQVYYGLGQAQSAIEQTYNQHGQAQALIKNIYNAYAQVQAWIETTYNQHGQAQGQIKTTYNQHGQAQADIKATSNVHGQAQADIKQTYNQYGQAQALIKSTYYAHGQVEAWIEQTYNQHGQAQGTIKQVYYQHGQAQASIKQVYYSQAQTQAQIKQTYFAHAQAQALITATYVVQGQAQAKINAYAVSVYGQAQGNIRFTGNAVHGQAQARIFAFDYPQHGQAQGTIEQTYNQYGQAQGTILQTYRTYSQSQAWIENTYNGLGQAQGDIKQTYSAIGQSNAYIIRVNQNVNGQTASWIKSTYNGSGQANAQISAYGVTQHGQAQAYITSGESRSGQSQGTIKTVSYIYAQAQAWIETTTSNHGQSQANIKQTYDSHGQSNALIVRTAYAHGQAQSQIKQSYVIHGQAQGTIEQTYSQQGQAQGLVKNIYNASGQANALIGTRANGYGQAQAAIETTYSQHGQAQGTVKQTYIVYGQAQGLIKTTNTTSGQVNAYIIVVHIDSGQAQAAIKNVYYASGQAQASILQQYRPSGQAQGRVKAVYSASGQAQVLVLNRYAASGQAAASIFAGGFQHGQAQAQIILIGQISVAQAQATVIKAALYGQAQALITNPHTLKNLTLDDDRPIPTRLDDEADTVTLTDEQDDIGLETQEDTITVTISDEASLGIRLDDEAF